MIPEPERLLVDSRKCPHLLHPPPTSTLDHPHHTLHPRNKFSLQGLFGRCTHRGHAACASSPNPSLRSTDLPPGRTNLPLLSSLFSHLPLFAVPLTFTSSPSVTRTTPRTTTKNTRSPTHNGARLHRGTSTREAVSDTHVPLLLLLRILIPRTHLSTEARRGPGQVHPERRRSPIGSPSVSVRTTPDPSLPSHASQTDLHPIVPYLKKHCKSSSPSSDRTPRCTSSRNIDPRLPSDGINIITHRPHSPRPHPHPRLPTLTNSRERRPRPIRVVEASERPRPPSPAILISVSTLPILLVHGPELGD